ncbi:hypothetical protein K9K77_02905 [Candidatus Babeliales bacterium]|nr:hypothetical protein [Candidatus Babeliales bacterium]
MKVHISFVTFLLLNSITTTYGQSRVIPFSHINKESENNIDKLILNYAPDIYFAKEEKYFPLTMESYLFHSETGMYYLKNRIQKKHTTGTNATMGLHNEQPKVLIAPGQLTLQKMINPRLYQGLDINGAQQLIFGDAPDTRYKLMNGKEFLNKKNGVIKTPYYALYSERGMHAYIQYFFMYGYNGTNTVNRLPQTTSIAIEHLTLQFDKKSIKFNNPKLLRIGFFASGSEESRWVNATNKDLNFRDKTHIIAYASLHDHGMYPEQGTYVSTFKKSHNITGQGTLWQPIGIIKLERPENKGYNKLTMGWITYPGDLDQEGTDTILKNDFFGQPEYEDNGVAYKNNFFPLNTPPKNIPITLNIQKPQNKEAVYTETKLVFNPASLPPKEIVVLKNTRFDIQKTLQPQIVVPKKQVPTQSMDPVGFTIEFEGDERIINRGNYYTIPLDVAEKVYLSFKNLKGEKKQTVISVREK